MHGRTGARVHERFLALILILFLLPVSCSEPRVSESPRPRVNTEQAPPARIISLAPSVTETLYRLGLGERVVGVTRYCDYPPEAAEKPAVGGYLDVNYEMVLSLEPDLVILISEHRDARQRLGELGLETLSVNHSRVQGILDSITAVAHRCGVEERGGDLRTSLERRIASVQGKYLPLSPRLPTEASAKAGPRVPASDIPRSRVLVAVARLMDGKDTGEIFVSGRDGFYGDLIDLAGGINAYSEETLKFPALSEEGLVRLDPDLILEMVPDLDGEKDRESLLGLWRTRTSVRAVREGRVHILGQDYVVVPGPRFVDLLEDMAKIIHSVGMDDQ